MVETHDDDEDNIVGTRDDSVSIVAWSETVWLQNKKAGNIQGKVLFLGNVAGTDKRVIEKVGSSVAATSEELFRDKSLMMRQMSIPISTNNTV